MSCASARASALKAVRRCALAGGALGAARELLALKTDRLPPRGVAHLREISLSRMKVRDFTLWDDGTPCPCLGGAALAWRCSALRAIVRPRSFSSAGESVRATYGPAGAAV